MALDQYFGDELAHPTELRLSTDYSPEDLRVASSREQRFGETILDVLKTPEEAMRDLWDGIQTRYWYMQPEYLNREPKEEWHVGFGSYEVPIYNYLEDMPLSRDQVLEIATNLRLFSALFPAFYPELEAITLSDHFPKYTFPDTTEFTLKGEAQPQARMFALSRLALRVG